MTAPLTSVLHDPSCPSLLTPSMLLTLKEPIHDVIDVSIKDAYRNSWKQVQLLANGFWKRWQSEYLQSLQQRPKWKSESLSLKVDDVVLIKCADLSRPDWPFGIITRVFPSESDSLVRTVEVKESGTGTLRIRPIDQLILL